MDAKNFLGNLYEKIATQKRSSALDKELEKKFSACNTSNLQNLTLILTPGAATPTYDEPRLILQFFSFTAILISSAQKNYQLFSSDDADHRRKRVESAEEGECNDDGVELRPSLRFAILNLTRQNSVFHSE